jgi:hypothetical protein
LGGEVGVAEGFLEGAFAGSPYADDGSGDGLIAAESGEFFVYGGGDGGLGFGVERFDGVGRIRGASWSAQAGSERGGGDYSEEKDSERNAGTFRFHLDPLWWIRTRVVYNTVAKKFW